MKIHAFKILKNENKKEGGREPHQSLKKKHKTPKKQFHGTLLKVTKEPTPH